MFPSFIYIYMYLHTGFIFVYLYVLYVLIKAQYEKLLAEKRGEEETFSD